MAMPKKITKQAEDVKKEVIDVVEETKELNEEVAQEVAETTEEKTKTVKDKVEEIKDKIVEKAKEVKDNLEDAVEEVKEKEEEAKEKIEDKALEVKEEVEEKANEAKEASEETLEEVQEKTEEKKEEIKEETEEIKEDIEEAKENTEEKAEEIKEEVKEATPSPEAEEVVTENIPEVEQEEIPKKYKALIDSKKPLVGKVKAISLDDGVLTLTVEGLEDKCKMRFDEFSNMDGKYVNPIEIMNGGSYPLIAKEYRDGFLWLSGKDFFVDFIRDVKDEPHKVKIVKFLEYGALCRFNDYNIFGEIRNSNFIDKPFVRVADVFKEKDELEVKIKNISNSGRVQLELVDKDIEVETKYDEDNLKPGVVIVGVVKSIHPFGCFVNLDVGLDGICSIPSHLSNQIHKGVKVIYKITSVNREDGSLRVRGNILGDLD